MRANPKSNLPAVRNSARMEVASRARWLVRRGLLLTGVILVSSCVTAPRWVAKRSVPPDMVERTLNAVGVADKDLRPEDVPPLPVRKNLRPCCAFGTHLQTKLGPLPIPVFSLGNIVSADDLGPHRYDSGAFSIGGASQRAVFTKENNGLVYTCRGGFLDTAHVRDCADWTVYWAATIARLSVSGGTIELPEEGGRRRVIIRPLPAQLVKDYGLRRTSIAMAQWLAFEMSIWHEIATAYGWASIDVFPEYVSAFSPEDIYSNLLGIKIAGGMMLNAGTVATDSVYDRNLDTWLRATLDYLGAVSVKDGKDAMYLVDGVWWDSKARLPDPRLVLRRNLDTGLEITPWVVSQAYTSPEMSAWSARHGADNLRPVILRRQDSLQGIKFSDYLTLQIDVEVPDRFPFPRANSKRITQHDYPAILDSLRAMITKRLGPGACRPERRR